MYTSVRNPPEPKIGLLIDLSDEACTTAYDNNSTQQGRSGSGPIYDNTGQKG